MNHGDALTLPPELVKRIERAGGSQRGHEKCIICRGAWDDCDCTRDDIDVVLRAYHSEKDLARVLKRAAYRRPT
jgi:hypothetical protein